MLVPSPAAPRSISASIPTVTAGRLLAKPRDERVLSSCRPSRTTRVGLERGDVQRGHQFGREHRPHHLAKSTLSVATTRTIPEAVREVGRDRGLAHAGRAPDQRSRAARRAAPRPATWRSSSRIDPPRAPRSPWIASCRHLGAGDPGAGRCRATRRSIRLRHLVGAVDRQPRPPSPGTPSVPSRTASRDPDRLLAMCGCLVSRHRGCGGCRLGQARIDRAAERGVEVHASLHGLCAVVHEHDLRPSVQCCGPPPYRGAAAFSSVRRLSYPWTASRSSTKPARSASRELHPTTVHPRSASRRLNDPLDHRRRRSRSEECFLAPQCLPAAPERSRSR